MLAEYAAALDIQVVGGGEVGEIGIEIYSRVLETRKTRNRLGTRSGAGEYMCMQRYKVKCMSTVAKFSPEPSAEPSGPGLNPSDSP